MLDLERTNAAVQLVREFRKKIEIRSPLERDRAWYNLVLGVKELGFSHPDEVIRSGVGSILFDEERPILKITRDWEDSQIQPEVSLGKKPSTIFLVVPKRPYIILQKNFTEDMLNDHPGITSINNAVQENTDLRRFVCLDKGSINVVGHIDTRIIKQEWYYNIFQTLAFEALHNLGVPHLEIHHNDILSNGQKIVGSRIKPECGNLLMVAFYISFNFDKSIFEKAFKDHYVYERMPEINLGLSENQVLGALKDQWEKMFGFSTGL